MTDAPDPGLTDLIAAHRPRSKDTLKEGLRYRCSCGWAQDVEWGDDSPFPAHVALVVEQHTNGRIAELEAELEKYHAEERRELEWDRFCAQQDVRCTECGLRYGERKDYTCPHIGEHKYDADELRAALEGES